MKPVSTKIPVIEFRLNGTIVRREIEAPPETVPVNCAGVPMPVVPVTVQAPGVPLEPPALTEPATASVSEIVKTDTAECVPAAVASGIVSPGTAPVPAVARVPAPETDGLSVHTIALPLSDRLLAAASGGGV